MISFKQFMTVEYRPGYDELINYRAVKRRRGVIGESNDCSCGCENCENCDCDTCTQKEALDFQQRRARARLMKKNKAKIAMGARKAKKRAADPARLQRRAKKAARTILFKKFAKGKTKSELPFARRQEIEKRLDKMKGRLDKIAKKILPDIRKREKERRSGGNK